MQACTELQRRFVIAMLETGGHNHSLCATMAGCKGSTPGSLARSAHHLAHHPAVLAAVQEEARKRMNSGAILGVSVLLEIAGNSLHKDRFKAATALLDRVGLHATSEHKVTVTNTADDKAMIAKIKTLAVSLGLDAGPMLKAAGIVIDAEFTDITPSDGTEGLEDILG